MSYHCTWDFIYIIGVAVAFASAFHKHTHATLGTITLYEMNKILLIIPSLAFPSFSINHLRFWGNLFSMRAMCERLCVFLVIVQIHVSLMFRAVDDFVYLVVITSAKNLIPEVALETGESSENSPIISYTCSLASIATTTSPKFNDGMQVKTTLEISGIL